MKNFFSHSVAIAIIFIFISCADIFNGKTTHVISLTIPALTTKHSHVVRSPFLNTYSPWTIYAFAYGKTVDIKKVETVLTSAASTEDIRKMITDDVLCKTILNGVDVSLPTTVTLNSIPVSTDYFVAMFITYGEHVVFRGTSPDNIIKDSKFNKPLHTVQSGANEISLELKKNTIAPVYFISQTGYETGKDVSGMPLIIDAQKSTPIKPTTYSNVAKYIVSRAIDTAVIILTDNITVEPDYANIELGNFSTYSAVNNLSFASLTGMQYSLTAKTVGVNGDARTLSLTDIQLITSTSTSVTVQGNGALLKIGGETEIPSGIELKNEISIGSSNMPPFGQIVITQPLTRNNYKLSVYFDWGGQVADGKIASNNFLNDYQMPLLTTSISSSWANFFTVECNWNNNSPTPNPPISVKWEPVASGWKLVPTE